MWPYSRYTEWGTGGGGGGGGGGEKGGGGVAAYKSSVQYISFCNNSNMGS